MQGLPFEISPHLLRILSLRRSRADWLWHLSFPISRYDGYILLDMRCTQFCATVPDIFVQFLLYTENTGLIQGQYITFPRAQILE